MLVQCDGVCSPLERDLEALGLLYFALVRDPLNLPKNRYIIMSCLVCEVCVSVVESKADRANYDYV